jgi:hypothetical protein
VAGKLSQRPPAQRVLVGPGARRRDLTDAQKWARATQCPGINGHKKLELVDMTTGLANKIFPCPTRLCQQQLPSPSVTLVPTSPLSPWPHP